MNILGELIQRLAGWRDASSTHLEAESGASEVPTHISINERGESAEVLPPVADLVTDDPWISFDNVTLDSPLDDYIARDPFPIPETCDREGYHGDRHYDYWLSGLRDYLCIRQVFDEYSVADEPVTVFDLGCASGRVLRHFLCQESDAEVWGADINVKHIDWILRFLGPVPRVFQNFVIPSLPLEDSSISLVYALSVFTHIERYELAWLSELRRVLRPGGVAYITLHTDRTWRNLNPHHRLYHDLLERGDFGLSPDSFEEPMPAERLMFEWPRGGPSDTTIFHSAQYIADTWDRLLDLIDIVQGPDYPDVAVLRKPS
jgi:SAM-dependent methyltransferase